MTEDDRAAWILAAVDALEGIRASEVAVISAELRRKVTRAAQIVPMIAEMVAERRSFRTKAGDAASPEGREARLLAKAAQWNATMQRTDIHWIVANGELKLEYK